MCFLRQKICLTKKIQWQEKRRKKEGRDGGSEGGKEGGRTLRRRSPSFFTCMHYNHWRNQPGATSCRLRVSSIAVFIQSYFDAAAAATSTDTLSSCCYYHHYLYCHSRSMLNESSSPECVWVTHCEACIWNDFPRKSGCRIQIFWMDLS